MILPKKEAMVPEDKKPKAPVKNFNPSKAKAQVSALRAGVGAPMGVGSGQKPEGF